MFAVETNILVYDLRATGKRDLFCCAKGALDMTSYSKLFDLAGKTAVVPGAASGIGKFSAEHWLRSVPACVQLRAQR
jgi:hypothetical protein